MSDITWDDINIFKLGKDSVEKLREVIKKVLYGTISMNKKLNATLASMKEPLDQFADILNTALNQDKTCSVEDAGILLKDCKIIIPPLKLSIGIIKQIIKKKKYEILKHTIFKGFFPKSIQTHKNFVNYVTMDDVELMVGLNRIKSTLSILEYKLAKSEKLRKKFKRKFNINPDFYDFDHGYAYPWI